jgi:hypothetical protein
LSQFTLKDYGAYYGYPECCVKDFIQRVVDYRQGKPLAFLERKLDGTGYIPCLICNEKSEEELLTVISSNRKCKKPFPMEDDEDDEL